MGDGLFKTLKLKVLVSFYLIVLLIKPWIDSCGELHVQVEEVDGEGDGEESSKNDEYSL